MDTFKETHCVLSVGCLRGGASHLLGTQQQQPHGQVAHSCVASEQLSLPADHPRTERGAHLPQPSIHLQLSGVKWHPGGAADGADKLGGASALGPRGRPEQRSHSLPDSSGGPPGLVVCVLLRHLTPSLPSRDWDPVAGILDNVVHRGQRRGCGGVAVPLHT